MSFVTGATFKFGSPSAVSLRFLVLNFCLLDSEGGETARKHGERDGTCNKDHSAAGTLRRWWFSEFIVRSHTVSTQLDFCLFQHLLSHWGGEILKESNQVTFNGVTLVVAHKKNTWIQEFIIFLHNLNPVYTCFFLPRAVQSLISWNELGKTVCV